MNNSNTNKVGKFNEIAYFYCVPQGPPKRALYQSAIVCLAQGFKRIGIRFCANNDYWSLSNNKGDYLFRGDSDVAHESCAIVIVDHHFVKQTGKLPNNLFSRGRSYLTVYMDREDGLTTSSWQPEFRKFDFILKTHYNARLHYPHNIKPWAFGLCDRVLDATENALPFQERHMSVLVNFRVRQQLRVLAKAWLLPKLSTILSVDEATENFTAPITADSYEYILYCQTGRRHYTAYYKRLRESAACACFGGYFVHPQTDRFWNLFRSDFILKAANRLLEKSIGASRQLRWPILQWDSWRFWEAMAAGCVPIHIDFEKYGIKMPIMPVNWKHYIGVDFENVDKTISRLREDSMILPTLSENGKRFAREHYGPVPTARRFLDLVLGKTL